MPLYAWCTGRSRIVQKYGVPEYVSTELQVSTVQNHSCVHLQMHEQMHVHAGWSVHYSFAGETFFMHWDARSPDPAPW